MSNVTRRDPFADFERAFDTLFNRGLGNNPANALPIDLVEEGDALVVRAGLPGLRPEDVEIQLDGNVLTLRGKARTETHDDAKVYHRELRVGEFARSLRLPKNLNLDAVEATVEHGIATVRIPKLEETKPASRRIEVKGLAPKAETTPTEA